MNNTQKTGIWDWLKRFFMIIFAAQIIISFIPLGKKIFEEKYSPKTKIAWIDLNGLISTSRTMLREIRWALKNDKISGVLLKIESGGGYSGSSELIFRELLRLREKKPVVVLVENLCASGAYFVASGASHIIAQESSLVGSIGVVMELYNLKKLVENWNVNIDLMPKGEYKIVGHRLGDRINEKEKKYINILLDENYNSFTEKVSSARGLTLADHKKWADGKIFSGSQALSLGLIDQLGDLKDAENQLKKLLNLEEEKELKFLQYPKASKLEKIFNPDTEDSLPETNAPSFFKRICTVVFETAYETFISKNNSVFKLN